MITPQIREDTGEGNTMAEQFLAEWGTAILFVNGRPAQCTVKALPCHTEQFCVKGRVCLSCSIPKSVHSEETSIKCRVLFHDASDVEPCTETGEDLALVSYYFHNYKISVGTLGDQKDIRKAFFDIEPLFERLSAKFLPGRKLKARRKVKSVICASHGEPRSCIRTASGARKHLDTP